MSQDTDGAAKNRGMLAPHRNAAGPVGRLSGRDRHFMPGWYEWTLRELARYFYALLILFLLIFVPLQMGDSWLPRSAPPVMSVAAVTAISLAFILGLCVLAALAYRYLWGEDGIVDRLVDRHFDLLRDRARTDKE